jgi:voltage-gated potassium channel Kch
MTGAGHPPPGERPARWTERAGAWLSEEALTGLLLILIVDIFVLPVLGPNVGETAVNAVFTVLLFTGLAAVASRGVAFVVIGILALAAAVLKWIAPYSSLPGSPAAAAGAAVAVFGLFTLLVLLRTLSPGPITRHRIEGAVAAYLLIAMTFALAYELMELVSPGSLEFVEGEPEVLERAVGYFSLVTFTTVGFGDVTPVTPLARRLAMLEGFIGQLYPAIIIGWMVSSMRPRGRD